MDLLSAIRPSVRVQNIIGVSPYSVNEKDIVAKRIHILPGLFVFIFNFSTLTIASQTSVETQAGKAFNATVDAGSVLVLTMVLGGICQTLAYFFTFLASLWQRHSHVEFYRKLLRIGRKMQKIIFSVLVIWTSPDTYAMAISFTCLYLSNTLSANDFILVCQVVSKHFSCLQKLLKEAQLEQDEFPHRLETFYVIHAELCDCFDLITENFGLRELFNVLSDFIFMTSQLFFSFWSANHSEYEFVAFGLIVILLPRCIKVSLIMYSGEKLIRTAHMTSKMLQKLDGPFKRAEFHDLAHNFALQVLHLQDLDVTAKNFFSLRLTFLFTLISACVMYFIVLIQFLLREI